MVVRTYSPVQNKVVSVRLEQENYLSGSLQTLYLRHPYFKFCVLLRSIVHKFPNDSRSET